MKILLIVIKILSSLILLFSGIFIFSLWYGALINSPYHGSGTVLAMNIIAIPVSVACAFGVVATFLKNEKIGMIAAAAVGLFSLSWIAVVNIGDMPSQTGVELVNVFGGISIIGSVLLFGVHKINKTATLNRTE